MSETTAGLPDLNGLLDELERLADAHCPDPKCTVCRLVAAVRAVAELAEELETDTTSDRLMHSSARIVRQTIADRLRAALAAALAPTGGGE